MKVGLDQGRHRRNEGDVVSKLSFLLLILPLNLISAEWIREGACQSQGPAGERVKIRQRRTQKASERA